MNRVRQAAITWLARASQRRHGRDRLPMKVDRRRIYIIPSRFGVALALLLIAMLVAGLNYNSNLGLAFGFLLASLALVAMHHCHRNLLGLEVDATVEVDAFAESEAQLAFVLRNDADIERGDIEIRCGEDAMTTATVPCRGYRAVGVDLPVPRRGVIRLDRFELRTRYPFGWFRAWTYVHTPLLIFIAPRPHGERPVPAAAAAGPGAPTELRGDEDFSGLRTYQPGMPLKHMAWKVLARGGEPAVRSYTGLAAQPEWLEWSALERLEDEDRLAQLCRWVLDAESSQQIYGLRIPGAEIPPARGLAHRSACLRALASYPTGRP